MLVLWLFENPTAYAQTAGRYELYDSSRLGVVQGFAELLRPASVLSRLGVWADFFSPSFLFLRGDASALHSTGRAGVFLLPVAVFLVTGFYQLVVHPPRASTRALLWAGLFTAPLAGVLVAEPHRISRASPLLVFVVLVATFGVEYLMSSPQKLQRASAIGLLALMPIQFGYFYVDYLTAYRVRSGFWFERNIRGAVEDVIAREPPGSESMVYVSDTIPFVDSYWKFYLLKYHRQDLLSRTVYFDARVQGLGAVSAPSVILTDVSDLEPGRPHHSDDLHPVRVLVEPDHTLSFSIYEK
jgi:hypothetical protein